MAKPKLLAPAGNFTSLRAAIDAGCDEVYFGMKGLNMRANADNFTIRNLKKVSNICHKNKVRAFLAINTIVYESELKNIEKIIKAAKQANIDAIIAWDMAVIKKCIKHKIEVHLSTQASVSNNEALQFYKSKIPNLKRVILARECSLKDIKSIIKNNPKVEIETFIHGAMCVSISGRCFLSQELFGKSANRGECLQPCRREYIVSDSEEKHDLSLGKDYILSPKDLCTMPFIDKLIDSGIASFKIEGRNRSPEYVSAVVSAYRKAIDFYTNNKKEKKTFEIIKKELTKAMKEVYNRDFSSGFFMGKPIDEWCKAYGSKATTTKQYIGKVLNYFTKISVAEIKLESGEIKKGDIIMFQGPTTGVFQQKAEEMQVEGNPTTKVEKGKRVGLKTKQKVRKNDKMFKIKQRRVK